MTKRQRHTAEQIAVILKQEAGLEVTEICRKNGFSEQSFFRWKSNYGGMGLSEVRRPKALKDENHRLNQLVAEKELDLRAMKNIIERNY